MSHQEEEDAAFFLFYPLLLISLKSAAVVPQAMHQKSLMIRADCSHFTSKPAHF